MNDPTEAIRRKRLAEINAEPGCRQALEAEPRQVWNTDELRQQFEVVGFMAPLVVVRRKAIKVRRASGERNVKPHGGRNDPQSD